MWELDPGASVQYHLHHETKELLLVLKGTLTVRTPDGEREPMEGDVLAFARGLPGAHGMANRSGLPTRYLMVAAHESVVVIEYPDGGTLCVTGRSESHAGEPLFSFYRLEDAIERDSAG